MPSMRKQAAPAAWRGLVLPGLLGLAAAVLFVVVYQTMSGGNTNLPQGAQVVPVVTGEGSTATMTVETTARMTTSTEAQQPAELAADAEAPLADAYFAPFVPDAPKRIPHQPVCICSLLQEAPSVAGGPSNPEQDVQRGLKSHRGRDDGQRRPCSALRTGLALF